MARRLNEFPKEKTEQETPYPWDRWLDGSIWKITKDSDFDEQLDTFLSKVCWEASDRDLIVRTKVQDASVIVQTFSPDQINAPLQLKSTTAKKRVAAHKVRVRLDANQVKELKKMARQNYTHAEIAEYFGVSVSTVRNKLAA